MGGTNPMGLFRQVYVHCNERGHLLEAIRVRYAEAFAQLLNAPPLDGSSAALMWSADGGRVASERRARGASNAPYKIPAPPLSLWSRLARALCVGTTRRKDHMQVHADKAPQTEKDWSP